MIKYFHELTKEEFSKLCEVPATWRQTAIDYPQPPWCGYPNAVCGVMGCWSLMDFMVTGRNFCKNCHCYIKKQSTVSQYPRT